MSDACTPITRRPNPSTIPRASGIHSRSSDSLVPALAHHTARASARRGTTPHAPRGRCCRPRHAAAPSPYATAGIRWPHAARQELSSDDAAGASEHGVVFVEVRHLLPSCSNQVSSSFRTRPPPLVATCSSALTARTRVCVSLHCVCVCARARACADNRPAHLEAVNVRFDHVGAFGVQVECLVETCQRLV